MTVQGEIFAGVIAKFAGALFVKRQAGAVQGLSCKLGSIVTGEVPEIDGVRVVPVVSEKLMNWRGRQKREGEQGHHRSQPWDQKLLS
jgi:hypothetical protein